MRFPDFDLLADSGERVTLASLRGQRVVLYFYPKDDTPGCTHEACELSARFPAFSRSGVTVLGVSPDSVKSHQKFKRKHALPFTLLVDEGHALAERLGIWVEKLFWGRKYWATRRTTYVIGPDGVVQHVFDDVNEQGHAEEVAAFLKGGITAATKVRAEFDAAQAAAKLAAKQAKAKAKAASPKKPAAKSPAKKKPAAKK